MNPATIEAEVANAMRSMPTLPRVDGRHADVKDFYKALTELLSLHIEFKSRRAYEKLARQYHVTIQWKGE